MSDLGREPVVRVEEVVGAALRCDVLLELRRELVEVVVHVHLRPVAHRSRLDVDHARVLAEVLDTRVVLLPPAREDVDLDAAASELARELAHVDVRATGVAPTELRERADSILAEVEKAIVGKRDPLELILLALLSDGHVLLEDYPGLAKTLIARSFAQATSLRFARIQFTPDLMPGDVTGSQIFDQRTTEFVFRPGPIFANLLLGDEINRAPPKTQAALLEAMQERQVTIENTTHRLEPPFLVLATQNPIEYEGTYPLPEAQLDRFLVRISIGYPARADEIEMLERRLERGVDEVELEPVVDAATLLEMQRALEQVHVSDAIEGYVVDLVTATRESQRLAVGASPRGSIALVKLSRAKAALAGRDFVTPEDVKAVAVPALAHRLMVRPELWVQRLRAEDVVAEALETVPTPPAEDALRAAEA